MMGSMERLAGAVRHRLAALAPRPTRLSLNWYRRGEGSWLLHQLGDGWLRPPAAPRETLIESVAARTQALGAMPLWDGYRQVYAINPDLPHAAARLERSSEQVRSEALMGRFFAWLALARRPQLIVEFGTAFGVSGMYWLAAIEAAGEGRLLTFEPNPLWQAIAERNLSEVGARYVAVAGTFEASIDSVRRPGERIDLAFVDAIHTSAFVRPQVELLIERLAPSGLILLDDIAFSPDMRQCWESFARDHRVAASVAVGGRVGVLELARGASPTS